MLSSAKHSPATKFSAAQVEEKDNSSAWALADLEQGLDGSDNRQVEGDHGEERNPARNCSQLPLPHPPPA